MKILHREKGFFVECTEVDRERGIVKIIHPTTRKEVESPVGFYDLDVATYEQLRAREEKEKERMKAAATENDKRYWKGVVLGEPGEDYVYQFGRLFVMNSDRKEFWNMMDEFSLEKNQYMKIKIREEVVTRFKNYDIAMFKEMFRRILGEVEAPEERKTIIEVRDRFFEWVIGQR